MGKIKYTCEYCGTEFLGQSSRERKFCSREHFYESLKGKPIREETRRKISEGLKGHVISKETREKIGNANRGSKLGPRPIKVRRKISEGLKGHVISKETREKIRKANSGKNFSEETRQKLRECNLGKTLSPETRKKISTAISGENHPQWRGGISFEPYCPLFNNAFKEKVREYFNRKCMWCGKPESENRGRKEKGQKLSVHHVNYDKMVCCNDIKPLFLPMCTSCHQRTNHDRDWWENVLTQLCMYVFNGRCW